MDIEQIRKRQMIKVVFTELIMVFAVIALVVVLVLIVSGYWINQNFEVERSGLLQVSSLPSGANVIIDGEDGGFFQRTNTSKMLKSGGHEIVLKKDGYDTWTKNVNIKEGLLYRLHYARLFLNERTSRLVDDYGKPALTSVSPDYTQMLLVTDDNEWMLLDLNSEAVPATKLEVAKVLPKLKVADVQQIEWSKNGDVVLLKDTADWTLLTLHNINKSVSFKELFGFDFDDVKFYDDSASVFVATSDGVLRKLDTNAQSVSKVLVENVSNFTVKNHHIIYVSRDADGTFVGSLSNDRNTEILNVFGRVYAGLSKFYNDEYLTVVEDAKVTIYKGGFANSMRGAETFGESVTFEIGFVPTKIYAGHNGEFYVFENGSNLATLDMEASKIINFTTEAKPQWLDTDMLYVVNDGDLIVYDYDGLNRRVLAQNVDNAAVTITEERWLYYFGDGKLMRENLLPE